MFLDFFKAKIKRAGSVPPIPPVSLRKIVGPTEESFFDNPTGELIWGPLEFTPLKSGEAYESIFDFGCGCGRNARQLMLQSQPPKEYLGIDISKQLIKWAQQNLTTYNENFKFLHHDVYSVTYAPNNSKNRRLPFPAKDTEYSLVNAHSVFTHLYYDQAEFYLKEARRVLRDKGLIRTTWFFFNKKFFPVLAPSQHCLYVNERDPTQAVYYDWEQFLSLIRSLDLAIVSVEWTVVPGFQNIIYLGKLSTFKDISSEVSPPQTIIGF